MSDVSYNVYMGKTVICHTLAMSTIVIVLYSSIVTSHMCICTGVSKNSRFSTVYVHKESSLIWPDTSYGAGHLAITYSISPLPCHLPWLYIPHSGYLYVLNCLADPQLHVPYATFILIFRVYSLLVVAMLLYRFELGC